MDRARHDPFEKQVLYCCLLYTSFSVLLARNAAEGFDGAILHLKKCLPVLHMEQVGLMLPEVDLTGPARLDLLFAEALPLAAVDLAQPAIGKKGDIDVYKRQPIWT